jgi:SAM-dependent methyltransferase
MGEEYVLGHTAAELARLDAQAQALAEPTRLAMGLAGLRPGMRVLDLGAGTGEVALLAAELVGPEGSVVSVDQSPEVLEYAAAKCADRGVTTVRFVQGDVATFVPDEPIDACVGRLVLTYLADPVATVRRYWQLLSPGGLYLALEFDTNAVRSDPPTALVTQFAGLVLAAFGATGQPQTMGPHLAELMRDAGVPGPTSLGLQRYFGPDDPTDPAMLVGVVSSLVPAIERHGLADVAALGLATARERMAAELAAARAVLVAPTLVAAWAHKG